jgi:hypothetical protein
VTCKRMLHTLCCYAIAVSTTVVCKVQPSVVRTPRLLVGTVAVIVTSAREHRMQLCECICISMGVLSCSNPFTCVLHIHMLQL